MLIFCLSQVTGGEVFLIPGSRPAESIHQNLSKNPHRFFAQDLQCFLRPFSLP